MSKTVMSIVSSLPAIARARGLRTALMRAACLAAAVAGGGHGRLEAGVPAVATWQGVTNLWNTGSNWLLPPVPTSARDVLLPSPQPAFSVIVMGTGGVARQVTVDDDYSITSGTLALAGQLLLGSGSGATLTVTAGGVLSGTTGSVGWAVNAVDNRIIVDGSAGGASLITSGILNVGYEGRLNRLSVVNAGTASPSAVWIGGVASSGSNGITVEGPGSLVSTNQLIAGYAGSTSDVFVGTLGRMTTAAAYVGYEATSSGNSVWVDGVGSLWQSSGPLQIGVSGTNNTVRVTSGAQVSATGGSDIVVGLNAGSTGNQVVVSSGSLSASAAIVVGSGGSFNSMTIRDGGKLTSARGRIGVAAGAEGNTALVTGAGSSWTVNGTVRVGDQGDANQLAIVDGATMTVTGGNNVWVGYGDGADSNFLSVTGSGSKLEFTGIGGELVVSATNGLGNRVVIAESGSVAVNSVQLGPAGVLQIGDSSHGNPAAGFLRATATITGNSGTSAYGGLVAFQHADPSITFANRMTGPLDVLHEGTGRTALTGSNSYTGKTSVVSGTLAVAGAGSIASSGTIALSSGATFDVTGLAGPYLLAGGQLLEGAGTVLGNTTVAVGGTISPGTAAGMATLFLDSDVNLLGTLSIGVSNTGNDVFDVSGGTGSLLTLNGSSVVDFMSVDPVLTEAAYIFAKYDTITGSFGTVLGLPSGYTIDYDYLGGRQIALVAVPEPSTAVLAVLGVAAMTHRRLRRRRWCVTR